MMSREYDVKGVMYSSGAKGERSDIQYIRGLVAAPSAISGAKIAEQYIRKTYKKVPDITNVNIYRFRRGAEIVRFN